MWLICHNNPTRVACLWGRTKPREGTKLGLAKKEVNSLHQSLSFLCEDDDERAKEGGTRKGARGKLDFCISALPPDGQPNLANELGRELLKARNWAPHAKGKVQEFNLKNKPK